MKIFYSIIAFVLFLSIQVKAQQRTITGTVVDNQGPVQGATVFEKAVPNNGVATDEEGTFQLTLKGDGQTVVIQSVGYLEQEIDVTGREAIQIQLVQDAKGLEEVVVVGYGAQKKLTHTGSVSSVSGDEIRQSPSASIQNTLMGRLPGFISQQRSGMPGQDGAIFNIRGISSFNGSTPLIIVDDIEYIGKISDIDPDQIESLSILKDAASTAVYGVKGANGVVVITTRRGKMGKPQITVASEAGASTPIFPFQYLDSYEVALLRNHALANEGLPPDWTEDDLAHFREGTDPYGHPNVDWADLLLRKSPLQFKNNINISGGTDRVNYFISGGFLSQDGLVKNFSSPTTQVNNAYYFNRYNFRSNLDIKATKSLSLAFDMAGSLGQRNEPNSAMLENNVFWELADYTSLPPFAYPVYNPDGSYGANRASFLRANTSNVVGRLAEQGYRRTHNNNLNVNLTAKQDLSVITSGLAVRGVLGYSSLNSYTRNLTRDRFPSYIYDPDDDSYTPYHADLFNMPKFNRSYAAGSINKRINLQGAINYDRTFANTHHVYGLALYTQFSRIDGADIPENFRGYTFRAGYDYKMKYLIEFNGAYNGTDRFESANRFGFFPAVSVGWNIAEEAFFKERVNFVDLFKIRASYGIVGSDQIGGFRYIYEQIYTRDRTVASSSNANSYSMGEVHRVVNGIYEGTLANTNVSWEKEQSANIGIDLNMFNGKLRLVADYFNRYRYDILLTRRSVPEYSGIGVPPVNMGRMNNRGFEIDLTYQNTIGKFSYNLNGNISLAKNKVLEIDEPTPAFPWLSETGGVYGRQVGYLHTGQFYTQEDLDNPDVAKPLIPVEPGDLKYKDINGDNIIDVSDQVRLPYSNVPNTIAGFSAGFSYDNFSVSVLFQAGMNFAYRYTGIGGNPFQNNLREVHKDTWTPENPDALFPRLTTNWRTTINDPWNSVSDFWNRRGDYLRLKNIELGYSLPEKWLSKAGIATARIYANGYNLMTWMLQQENIYDIDPESPTATQTVGYPQQKIYNFGVQVSF